MTGTAAPESTTGPEPVSWYDNLPPEAREVFLHIEAHGSITELEVNNKLGNPRKTRRFTADFDTYVKQLPFNVEIETTGTGKRWNKI